VSTIFIRYLALARLNAGGYIYLSYVGWLHLNCPFVICININLTQALQECEEVISLYRGDKLDVPVPACDQKVVDDSHENFLKHMSNDLHTTAALDELMKPVRAINSNLSDLKVYCSLSFAV
jgi:hypothetical protein